MLSRYTLLMVAMVNKRIYQPSVYSNLIWTCFVLEELIFACGIIMEVCSLRSPGMTKTVSQLLLLRNRMFTIILLTATIHTLLQVHGRHFCIIAASDFPSLGMQDMLLLTVTMTTQLYMMSLKTVAVTSTY